MNKRLLLIIGGIVAVVAVLGAVFFFATRQQPAAPTPTATPQAEPQLRITVTPPAGSITASASASFDILLNTNGTRIDGFQFIANLDGAGVLVSDSDSATAGVQIAPATVTGMNPVNNSVTAQGTTQVIRFAMITQNASQPFSSTTPVKVASVTFVPATSGSVKLEFNTQNTRANRTGTTDDTLITAASQTFNVLAPVTTTATQSATIAQAQTSGAVSCDAACLTDNDCSVGLSCISNSCRNPANPTSLTCSAVGATATSSATATPRPSPTATPISQVSTTSATPRPTASPTPRTATIAALPSALPESGSVEYTFFLVAAGLACMGLAAFFMLRTI